MMYFYKKNSAPNSPKIIVPAPRPSIKRVGPSVPARGRPGGVLVGVAEAVNVGVGVSVLVGEAVIVKVAVSDGVIVDVGVALAIKVGIGV